MKSNEYKCDGCGGIFEKGWSDEEAKKESKQEWGDLEESDQAVICDDCYKRLMSNLERNTIQR